MNQWEEEEKALDNTYSKFSPPVMVVMAVQLLKAAPIVFTPLPRSMVVREPQL